MKRIFFILLLILSVSLAEVNVISPSGSYYLGDDIRLIGNYEGNCNGTIALKLDGKVIDEKNYVFSGVTDLSQVFSEKINASVGSHLLEVDSTCFQPVVKDFEVKNQIPINYALNSFNFMTGEEAVIKAYGVKGKKLIPCEIIINNESFYNETKISFDSAGVKQVILKSADKFGNFGEKKIYLNVFDKLIGKVNISKEELSPSENLTIYLSVVDFLNRTTNYNATTSINGVNYFFKKVNGTKSKLVIPLSENQAPGGYSLNISFKNGSNKGTVEINFIIKNEARKIIIVKNEKNSNESFNLIKIVLLNQVNEPFKTLVNVTIESNGKKETKEVKSEEYFKVPPNSVVEANKGNLKTSRAFMPSKKQKSNKRIMKNNSATGLAIGKGGIKNKTIVWGVLFFLIIASVFFLRNSELLAEV